MKKKKTIRRIRDRKKYLKEYHRNNYKPSIKYQVEEKGQWVYVLYNQLTNRYKIGISKNPIRRMAEISTQSGMDLENVMLYKPFVKIDPSAKVLESFLHDKNKDVKHYVEGKLTTYKIDVDGINVGHEYGTKLSDEEKLYLIEYIKTLGDPEEK